MMTGGSGHQGDGEQRAAGLHRGGGAAAALVRDGRERAEQRDRGARNGAEAAAACAARDGGGCQHCL